jgi:hypothetical protein
MREHRHIILLKRLLRKRPQFLPRRRIQQESNRKQHRLSPPPNVVILTWFKLAAVSDPIEPR